ncbi:LacI family DNA-binding transcriptional regulator [Cognatishimia sp. 1_MG-2023]|uniref:LacI family DNA-binding transcriptional regulator n=1 Tax=Cognatishimia sp. 1_MG-2023 TaxID=3062642 RepID=UPI0026E3E1CF|nr:LacI family DNA-binding transcriptional regulator [Cognatishimia sp. 1_MG-2023]MDO6726994.1 LacI family DNA-binding transcriptional regulator [Cognatishimia sp. 1_MG-2023]
MPETETAPTLDDVALAARVSTATVSRCINDPKKVSQKTRDRVEAAIDKLGYTPNFAARSMAAKRTFTIGAIIPTMENAIFARGIQAFQEELYQHGYTLLISSSGYKAEAEKEQIKTLVARGADALLLIGHDRDPAIYDYLERQRVPTLVAWSYDETAQTPSIGFDNRTAMRALAETVIAKGHTSIAMISGISQQNDRARLRIEGVKDAMLARGLDPDTLDPIEVPYNVNDGASAFVTLMSRHPRPSIVMCGNDVLAVGALRGAAELGLNVPEDISITGYDDLELAQVVSPALTTVRVPHREMGRNAACEIVDMIEKKRKGVSQKLKATVVERASVAQVQ